MRAWQVTEQGEPADVLGLVEIDPPEPGPGQVAIAVEAAAVGLPDVLMCRGTYPLTPELPFTPGQEVAGTVAAVGDGVAVEVGTPVMAVTEFGATRGGFAAIALADWDSTFVRPDSLQPERAAGFSVAYLTAWIGLVQRGGMNAGDHVVVLGAAGGSGSAAVDLAHALGGHVIAVAGGSAKGDHCRALGADVVIDHRTDDVSAGIRAATDGRGADLVFDTVGGDGTRDATAAMANEGRLLLIGFAAGSWPRLSAQHAVGGNYSIVGAYVGAYGRDDRQAMVDEMVALVESGTLAAAVTDRHAFEDLPTAMTAVAERRVIGRAILLGPTVDSDRARSS